MHSQQQNCTSFRISSGGNIFVLIDIVNWKFMQGIFSGLAVMALMKLAFTLSRQYPPSLFWCVVGAMVRDIIACTIYRMTMRELSHANPVTRSQSTALIAKNRLHANECLCS